MSPHSSAHDTASPRSGWRWFPHASVAALGVVVIVNVGLTWAALGTYPGEATKDDFGTSNRYNAVLALAAKEAALGWKVDATAEAGHAVLRLFGPDGRPLEATLVSGVAERPLGADVSLPLTFRRGPDGAYVASEALEGKGQWELRLSVERGADHLQATRRIIIR